MKKEAGLQKKLAFFIHPALIVLRKKKRKLRIHDSRFFASRLFLYVCAIGNGTPQGA